MAHRLFYWFPKSVKKTGEVYKSWRDWMGELFISRNQVYAVHAAGLLEKIGFTRRQRQTAKGNPVHYGLNVEAFLQAVADFLEVTLDTIIAWITDAGKSSKPLTDNQASPCVDEKQDTNITSITKETPITKDKNNNNDAVAPFSIPGMKTFFLLKLIAQYGSGRVKAMYDHAREIGAKNVPGCVVKGLAEDWELPQNHSDSRNPFAGMTWSDFAE